MGSELLLMTKYCQIQLFRQAKLLVFSMNNPAVFSMNNPAEKRHFIIGNLLRKLQKTKMYLLSFVHCGSACFSCFGYA
jgi:hypothetical protein